MATSVPPSFKPHAPVTPPPDQHMFMKAPFPPQPPRSDFLRAAYEATGVRPPQERPKMSPPRLDARGTSGPMPNLAGANAANNLNNTLRDPGVDPRYLAMASRIASYYQQRCQAVTNFQQQRCQAWANAQRQKCQELTQAAMLVVAWYIRDRIKRRRRRQRRSFKRGLKQNARLGPRSKITKGETVRRWVMDVTASPKAENNDEKRFLDKEEETFEMDKEDPPVDKDTQLFNVADGMIKSQMGRIDVPLLGVLSFDESDDESESESEEEEEEEEDQDNFEQAGDEDMNEDDDEDGEFEEVDAADSKSVHLGTSNKQTRSSYIS